MDFFGYQEQARKRTSLLVIYLILAVILIIFAIYSVINYALFIVQEESKNPVPFQFWNPDLFSGVAIVVIVIILLSALIKIFILSRGGGAAVAEMLGGRLVDYESASLEERKLLNVVEEMAIASGVPVPPVYILEESSINAFAAGFSPFSAVIGVTRGAVEKLTRDELQGVIAHEFSHILNGDMRLNIKLIGIIFGILVIHVIGRLIVRTAGQRRFFISGRGKGASSTAGIALFLTLIGLSIMLIGWIGVLFARVIQSAISRQREFLADASAVQFTRNPYGLLGALKKIASEIQGSLISHPKAEEASHMFFANGISNWLNFLFATHPPIEARIKRLDPSATIVRDSQPAEHSFTTPLSKAQKIGGFSDISLQDKGLVSKTGLTNHIGNLTFQHIAEASSVISQIPLSIRNELYNKTGAQSFILALIIFASNTAPEKKKGLLQFIKDQRIQHKTSMFLSAIEKLPRRIWLASAELAIRALNSLSKEEISQFTSSIKSITEADNEISLFEYALIHIVRYTLVDYKARRDPPTKYFSIKEIEHFLAVLLSTLARFGRDQNQNLIERAFNAGLKELKEKADIALLSAQDCGLEKVDQALQELAKASYPLKREIISACAACISADGTATIEEAELFRAIGAALQCPIPLIIPEN